MRLIRIKTYFLILFYRYNFISIKNFIQRNFTVIYLETLLLN